MEQVYEALKSSAEYVMSKINYTPEAAIVLGSGLGALADEVEDAVVIPYKEIECFPESTVPFHAGKLVLGTLAGKKVVCMSGRFHHYEGHSYQTLAAPVRLLHLLGVRALILTNAAGAVNTAYKRGDLMIISDHINLAGASPMMGRNMDQFGPRFFDVSTLYSPKLRELARTRAAHSVLTIHEGVYMYFVGPHFETPAEIRAARILGADAVGMSTVTEALTAAHCGLPVLGVSMMTNMAAGILDQPLSGEEVGETAELLAKPFCAYIKDILCYI